MADSTHTQGFSRSTPVVACPPTVTNNARMSFDQLNGPPSSEQICVWMQENGHSNQWLAQHLGTDAEDVLLCHEVGFHEEDLQIIAELMTHTRENLGE